MRSYSSREVIKRLKAEGWYLVHTVGDHHQYKHPTIPGKVTITHPVKDVAIHIMKDIQKKTGLKF
ncbi:type II toxin-antitoxin system HicA family toxin [Paenibacillus campi]|uniref:type II toxin-antitoxin system HicA family toxin n=1 Tax=Paenibacillus campi TaxID=3106031 RepID=UPI002AFE3615|nr:type II toxin-antitoxin system HicA family toxin [Paenibacillus sp. SGZ-1014]